MINSLTEEYTAITVEEAYVQEPEEVSAKGKLYLYMYVPEWDEIPHFGGASIPTGKSITPTLLEKETARVPDGQRDIFSAQLALILSKKQDFLSLLGNPTDV